METFTEPEWFGSDVSDNKALKNKNLALHGFPKDIYSQEAAQKFRSTIERVLTAQ